MGKLVIEQIISADGYAEDRDGKIDFFVNERCINDADEDQLRSLETAGAIVLGRRTFELFEGYWARMDSAREPVAGPINALPKYVVSNSLERAPWGDAGNSARILRGDGATAVRDLKEQVRGDLIVWGSLTLCDALLRQGVADVLRLRVLPKLIGAGRSFTPSDLGHRNLSLRGVQSYKHGFVVVEYAVS